MTRMLAAALVIARLLAEGCATDQASALLTIKAVSNRSDLAGPNSPHNTRKMLQRKRGPRADDPPLATPKIAGGTDAPCGRYTYMVSLRDDKNVHKCGGVLVDARWVLTAAHCVDPSIPSLGPTPVMAVGACRLSDGRDEGIEISLPKDAFIHPNWTGDVSDGYDVAMLELQTPSNRTPVGLPSRIERLAAPEGGLLALGWGEGADGERPSRLQQGANIEVISTEVCNEPAYWNGILEDSMVCAFGMGGTDTCQGDSGGPLVRAFAPNGIPADGSPELDIAIGITSFGFGRESCAEDMLPSVYMSLSHFRDWIDEVKATSASQVTRPGRVTPPLTSPPSADTNNVSSLPSAVIAPPREAPDASVRSDKDVDVDLWRASENGNLTAVEQALERGADTEVRGGCCGNTALMAATVPSHSEVVQILLRANAGVDARNDLEGVTAIYIASALNHVEIVRILMEAGADLDQPSNIGATPLYTASARDHALAAGELIDGGADVERGTHDGMTPLAIAARKGAERAVEVLLEGGADPNGAASNGSSPLHFASNGVGGRSERVVRLLLDAGADIDARNDFGETPLARAVLFGNLGSVEILLDAGADAGAAGGEENVCGCRNAEGDSACPEGGCDQPGTEEAIRELLLSGR